MRSLDALMRPQSVAIIGASNDATRIGGRPVDYLLRGAFAGAIYPINPSREEVQGLKAYPTVEAVPGPVDCAIIATPTGAVLEAVQSCVRKGVQAAVIFSAGLAEVGPEGLALQDEIVAAARAGNMRILGPNCLGMFNVSANSYLTFSGTFDDAVGTSGRIGLVSQSGGYAGELLKQAKRLGLSFGSWITTGNEADVEAGEVIAAYAADPNIDVILAYLEAARNSETLIAGLEAARQAKKPVIVLKVGRSEQGAAAAAAHTASLAGADAVYDAVFARYGAYRARSTEEMLDLAYACGHGVFPKGNRLVILTASGGIGVQTADFAEDEGLNVAPLPDDVKAEILRLVPNAGVNNPVDLTGALAHDPELYAKGLELALATGQFDMAYVNIGVLAGMAYAAPRLLGSLTPVAQRYPEVPKLVGVMASDEIVAAYEEAGYIYYGEPARALRTLAGLYWFTKAWARPAPQAAALDASLPSIPAAEAFSEAEAKAIIAGAGIPVPQEHLVTDAAGALAAAARIGGPVAIKVVSPDLLHKSDVGGVALDVAPADAGRALDAMRATVRGHAPQARIEGYLVTPMIRGGTECFLGARQDPVFGTTLTFGLGGVAVEVYRDVTTRVAPIDHAEALEMIGAIKGAVLLNGYRGRPKADVAALADAMVRLAALAQANAATVDTIEINPLLVFDEGQFDKGRGAVALDAVIAPRVAG